MEVYRRITERVRGALWAHHRRLLPERQFHRILAYVYNNKYEFQIRLDKMQVVGHEWGGKVEVVTTPAGHLQRVRVHPSVEDLSPRQQRQLVLAAYAAACREGHRVMQAAEDVVYRQFLVDLKPIIFGIRDNPEFYTVPEETIETIGGTLAKPSSSTWLEGGSEDQCTVHRTIPVAAAQQPSDVVRERYALQEQWLQSPRGQAWARTLQGKRFFAMHAPEYRPRGAPGAKKAQRMPLELPAPYTPMDEGRLLKKNWMAYLDNKHVAETLWTRSNVASREKKLRQLQQTGQAWHRVVNQQALQRW